VDKESPKITDGLCPRCKTPMVSRDKSFYWRGRHFKGLVCDTCKSLYDDPTDSFLEYVRSQR